jgi:hypothetical protein
MNAMSERDVEMVEAILVATAQTEKIAREQFAQQIVKFTRWLSQGKSVDVQGALLAVAVYAEEEARVR